MAPNRRAGIWGTVELDGDYRSYLEQTLEEPEAHRGWRDAMRCELRAQTGRVSELRTRTLAMADQLYRAPRERFAATFVAAIADLTSSPGSTRP